MKKITTLLFILLSVTVVAQRDAVINPDSALQVGDVVITAERTQLPVSMVSRSVSILTAEDLKKLPVQSLNEALSHVSGVDIRQRGALGGQADVGIRGSSFDQVLVMIDGVKIIDPQTGHHTLNLPLNTEYIERIEVLKGSGARMYGANAFAGVINIVTKKVDAQSAVTKVFGGDFGLSGTAATITLPGQSNGGQMISASATSSTGYRPGNDFANQDGFYKNEKRIAKNLTADVMGTISRRKLGAAGYYVANSTEYEEVNTSMLHGRLKYDNQRLTLNTALSWRYNDDHYIYARKNPDIFQNHHHTHVIMGDVQGTYKWNANAGTTGFGADYRHDEIYSNNLGNRQRNFYNAYVDHTVNFYDIRLSGGANASYIDGFGWQLFPGVDITRTFLKRLNVYASYNKSYRVPTYTDLYYSSKANIGNPNLQPEQAWNAEVGVKYIKDNWFAQISGFNRHSKNLIDWVRDNDTLPYQPVNYQDVSLTGAEIEVRRNNLGIFSQVSASYTYMDATLAIPTSTLSRYALAFLKHQVQVRATVNPVKRLFVTAAYRYNERINQPAYHLLDAKIEYRMPRCEVFAEVSNVTNTNYVEAGFVPMPGRWARGGVKVLLGQVR